MGNRYRFRLNTAGGGGGGGLLGLNTIGGSSDSWTSDYAIMNRKAATASGVFTTAFFYNGNGSTQNLKIAAYASSGAAPAVGDTQLGISSTIAVSGVGWFSAVMSGGVAVNSVNYWLAVFLENSGGGVQHQYDGLGTLYYLSTSGYYASPPANLGGVTSNAAEGIMSAYITIV